METLFMSIPDVTIKFVIDYFPALYKFGLHDESNFVVSDDKLSLQAISGKCDGFMIYADLYHKNDIGFNAGIHYWSVKALQSIWGSRFDGRSTCYRSIGITTTKTKQIVKKIVDTFVSESQVSGYHYYFNGCRADDGWIDGQIITVKLNCNEWTVSYYKDSAFKRMENIEPNQHYFFTLSCCAEPNRTSLQIVETPALI